MDLSRLKTSDFVILGSALVLLIGSFLDWFTVEATDNDFFSGEVAAGNGWDVGFFWAGIPVLLGLAMAAYVAIRAFAPQTQLPEAPWGTILVAAGGVAAAIVVLKLLIGEDDDGFGDIIEVKRAVGLFISALAAIGLGVGGFLKFQEKEGPAPSAGSTPPTPF